MCVCVCVCLALLTVFCLFNGFVLHSASASTSTRAQVSTATAIELSHKRVKWAGIAILLALPLSYHISLAAPCQAFAICILNWQSIHGIDSLRVALVPCDQALEVPTYFVIANLRNVLGDGSRLTATTPNMQPFILNYLQIFINKMQVNVQALN